MEASTRSDKNGPIGPARDDLASKRIIRGPCDGYEKRHDPAHAQRDEGTGVSSGLTEERNYIKLRYLYDESEAVHGFDENIWIAGWRGIGST